MKRKSSAFLRGTLALALALCLCGCGGTVDHMKSELNGVSAPGQEMSGGTSDGGFGGHGDSADKAPDVDQDPGADPGAYAPEDAAAGRKLIRTVSVRGESKEYDRFRDWLDRAVKDAGGYFESRDEWQGSRSSGGTPYTYRELSCVIRLPAGQLDWFTDVLGGNCNVTRTESSVQDVTLSYVDLESRKEALEIEQERLLALLEQSGSLEEILMLENRLSEVRYELGNYASQLLVMENQVEYGTVNLDVAEVVELTRTEGAPEGFLDKLSAAFIYGAEGFRDGLADLSFVIAANVLPLAVLAAAGFGVWRGARRIRKRVRGKKDGSGPDKGGTPG